MYCKEFIMYCKEFNNFCKEIEMYCKEFNMYCKEFNFYSKLYIIDGMDVGDEDGDLIIFLYKNIVYI